MIVSNNANNQSYSLREKCPYSDFFWFTFSHIRTLPISSYSVRMPGNTDQNNSEYGHLFTQWFFTFSCQCSHFFQCFSVFCCICCTCLKFFSPRPAFFYLAKKSSWQSPQSYLAWYQECAKWWRYQCNKESENRFKLTLANLQKSQILAWKYCLLSNMQSIFPARCHLFTKSAVSIASVIRVSSFTFWSVPRDETTKEVNNLPQLRAVGTIKLITT